MNKGIVAFIGFTAGGIAGFFAGKKLMEEHYNQMVQEEVDSVKEAFRNRIKEMSDAKATLDVKPSETGKESEPDVKNDKAALAKALKAKGLSFADIAQKMGMNESTIRSLINDGSGDKKDYRAYYTDKKAVTPAAEEAKEEKAANHYIIPPEEFGTNAGYEEISLTYYSDGVVADDDENIMSDEEIEKTIGFESLKHFGEYEPDSVFVRNDHIRADYEILQDERSYEEAAGDKAYK